MEFYPYLMTGYPSDEVYLEIIDSLVSRWVKNIEAGIPFSDPSADGATLTAINHTMVQQKKTLTSSLELLKRVKEKHSDLNICLMTYVNPILQIPTAKLKSILQGVVDSLLIPDLPIQESCKQTDDIFASQIVKKTSIISPNLPDHDIQKIVEKTDGFCYLLNFIWTTWSQKSDSQFKEFAQRVRKIAWPQKKLIVGFWVKDKSDIEAFKGTCIDGYIIWSALAQVIQEGWPAWVEAYLESLGHKKIS